MTSYLHQFIAFVSLHALLAYCAIFAAAFLEAAPVLGSLIPGSTVILALSALVPSGNLELAPVLASAFLGAVLGDGLAFLAGYRAKRRILDVWPMTKYPTLIAQSEAFFHRHGTLAVFFARFVPPVRAFVPIIAGALGMRPLLFFGVNMVAVAVWAPVIILPGVLAGSAAEQWGARAEHYGWPLVGGIIAVGATAWIIYHVRRKARDFSTSRSPASSD